jgi:6-phosphogluconolactonase (cycloisomerase 2 family)
MTGGTITAGATTTSITFTPGASGTVDFSCVVTNAANTASTAGTASSTIVPAPTTPVVTAPANVTASQAGYTASIPAQSGSTYAWTLTGGTITAGATTTSITFTPGASGTVGFSCIVTNAANTASTAGTASSTIVAAPATPTVVAPANVTAGKAGYTASISAQAGSTYAWTLTGGTLTAGATTTSVTFTPGASGTVDLSCIVTNAANTASTAGTGSSTIVPIPSISQLSASPADVLANGTATLSYHFTGGIGVITPGDITVTSGGSNTVTPATTTTYTLTVTNPANSTITDTVTVSVGAAAAISSFTALPATISAGQGTLLTFNFTGDGTIDHGVGAVTSGHQVAVFPTVNTTYTLSVTSSLGGTPVTATVPVTVGTYTGKFVYVANSGGGVSAFTLNDTSGALTPVSGSPFDDGVNALHVTSDPGGKFLFVVNGDGLTSGPNTLTVFTINPASGVLAKVAAYAAGTDPWASAVDPSGKFVYVRSEAAVRSFSLNGISGVLTPLATTATSAGTGEVLVAPSGTHLYTVGRTSDSLQVFNLNTTTGALTSNSTLGLPTGAGPLALALSHSGEYLFTKSEGAPGGAAQTCVVYGYFVDAQTGGLTPIADTSTGLEQADAFHGVSANPTLPVIYITLAFSANDFAAYAMNILTGELTALDGATYALFDGTGSDSLVVSRNGKWGFLTNFGQDQIAVGQVSLTTGILSNPTFVPVGISPVSVTVVGTVQ